MGWERSIPNRCNNAAIQEQEGSDIAWGQPTPGANLFWEDVCVGEMSIRQRPSGGGGKTIPSIEIERGPAR